MRQNYNNRFLLLLIVFLFLTFCKENTQVEDSKPVEQKIVLNEQGSLFNTIPISQVFEIPYERFEKIDTNRFRKELGDKEGNIYLYDFYEIKKKQSGRTYLSIQYQKETRAIVSSLKVEMFEGIDTLKEVFCINFNRELRDCRLSFTLSSERDMKYPPVNIYMRSRNDKLFYLMHPNVDRPMFFGHGHNDSIEFLTSAKEAYKLYKLEKNAPPLSEFGFSEEEASELDTMLSQD